MALNFVDATVIGIRPYSFEGQDHKPVVMSQIYVTFADKRTEGTAACSFNISERKAIEDAVDIGSAVRICFTDKRWQYVSPN